MLPRYCSHAPLGRAATTLDLYTRRSDGEDSILRALGALDEADNEET